MKFSPAKTQRRKEKPQNRVQTSTDNGFNGLEIFLPLIPPLPAQGFRVKRISGTVA